MNTDDTPAIVPRGGGRGPGRPRTLPPGTRHFGFRLTAAEAEAVRQLIRELRGRLNLRPPAEPKREYQISPGGEILERNPSTGDWLPVEMPSPQPQPEKDIPT